MRTQTKRLILSLVTVIIIETIPCFLLVKYHQPIEENGNITAVFVVGFLLYQGIVALLASNIANKVYGKYHEGPL